MKPFKKILLIGLLTLTVVVDLSLPFPSGGLQEKVEGKVNFNLSSTIRPSASHLDSRGIEEISSQSNSVLKSQSKPKSGSLTTFEGKKPHNSISSGKANFLLTNGRRQIGNSSGNPISYLHTRNGQGGGGEGVKVTDVDSKFRAGSSERVSSIPQYHHSNPQEGNTGNVNSDTNIKIVSESFVRGLAPDLRGEKGDVQNSKVGEKVEKVEVKGRNDDTPIDTNTLSPNSSGGNNNHIFRQDEGERTGVFPAADEENTGVGHVNADLYLKGEGGERPCFSVVVTHQKTKRVKGGEDDTLLKDVDKWTRTLVKTSQCVANCLGSLSFMNKFNMSPKKGINEQKGPEWSNFPMGISSLAPNYNGDVSSFNNHLGDKLLPTCQRRCSVPKFLPQKSLTLGETNKAWNKSGDDASHASSNHREVSELRVKQTKDDKNSSRVVVDLEGKEDARKENNAIHLNLHWPHVSKNKIPLTIYTIMVQQEGNDADDESESSSLQPWKLIDQTVAPQISLRLRLDETQTCQEMKEWVKKKEKEIIISPGMMKDNNTDTYKKLDKDPAANVQDKRPQFYPYGGIRVKVLAVGAKGLEKVFSGLILLSPTTVSTTSLEKFESTSSSESTCCQEKKGKQERESIKKKSNLQTLGTLVIQNGNKNSGNVVSNKINLKNPSASKQGDKVSYNNKVESDPTTNGIGTNEVKNANNNPAAPTTPTRATNSIDEHDSMIYLLKGSKAPMRSPTRLSSHKEMKAKPNWGLRMNSMVSQSFLVVAQVSWNFPGGVSNQEKNAAGHSSNNNKNESGGNSNNLAESVGAIKKKTQRYQFLLTWEMFGGGLMGNLVTDSTSGNISLWHDTAYFIQVGLIDGENPATLPITRNLVTKLEEQEQHQNYMSNSLLGLESIIFPLSGGEPRVTLTSERLFVNTSQLSKSSLESLPSLSPRSLGASRPRPNERSGLKSNNPRWQGEIQLDEKSKYLKKKGENVSPITIPGGTVSTNGNSHPNQENGARVVVEDYSNVRQDSVHKHNKKYSSNNQRNAEATYRSGPSSDGYLGDGPSGVKALRKNEEEEGEDEKVHSHSHKVHYLHGAKSAAGAGKNSTRYQDKTANINDNKSNNILKQKKASDHHQEKNQHQNPPHHHEHENYKPEGYQGLFALNLGLGGYNYNYDAASEQEAGGRATTNATNGHNSSGVSDTGASVIYSIFVLVVVACVMFLFLVAFIGFFVVTSSITQTAQYFIPKKLKIWVVGERELLAGGVNNESEETEDPTFDGRLLEDLDDEGGPEWGECEMPPQQQDVDLTQRPSRT